MERIKLILATWVLLSSLYGFSQVGIGTNAPNESSILDLSSTSKGLLVPRMTTVQRLSIVNPAEGLLVFDLDDGMYHFFHASNWHKLLGIQYGDEIRFGDSISYTEFESDGTIVFYGNATVFKDQSAPLEYAKPGGNAPTWGKFMNNGQGSVGVYAWLFSDAHVNSENEVFLTIELPHDWKEGSSIFPHVHWSPTTGASGVVRWGIEYTWVDIHGTFSPTTFLYADSGPLSSGTLQHMVTDFDSIVPASTQGHISSMLLVRLFRNSSHPDDTYPDKAAGLSFDFHYEINTIGSRTRDQK